MIVYHQMLHFDWHMSTNKKDNLKLVLHSSVNPQHDEKWLIIFDLRFDYNALSWDGPAREYTMEYEAHTL